MNIKNIYNSDKFFILGIGGSGMSSIAKFLIESGMNVKGYDQRKSQITTQLLKLGVEINNNTEISIPDGSIVLTSSAIDSEHDLINKSKENKLEILDRPDFLSKLTQNIDTIGVAGSHGKTSTSALLSHIYSYNKIDYSHIYGGITPFSGLGGHYGSADKLILETDEAFKTFQNFELKDLILTNIDDDHLDHYGSFENMLGAFEKLVEKTSTSPILNNDDASLKSIASKVDSVTYGSGKDCIFQYKNINSFRYNKKDYILPANIPSKHFTMNAIAAIANANMNGVEIEQSLESISTFSGVKRRSELIGIKNGIKIYDDYGHHPTEMDAIIQSLKYISEGSLFVVFQPHRYTRTEQLFDRFIPALENAHKSFILDIYSAGEEPIPGVSTKILLDKYGISNVSYINSSRLIPGIISQEAQKGDVVLTLGAGDVTLLGKKIMDAIDD